MLLTITTTHRPTTDLGFLLHKHPDRFQSFDLSFGHAHVFNPETSEDRITAALMLDVDPVGMVRGKNADQGFLLGQYVNDRPYVKQTISTLPDDFKGSSYCADLKITPDGKFLYGTNRGHDSIAAFQIGEDGRLSLVAIEPSLGKGPQNLAITPDGQWLLCANLPGNNVAVFKIDAKSGRFKSAGDPVKQSSPSCIMLIP